ncbi:hypothetical protein QFC22_001387 [Naganishia vaughanmartiniae]|uniref:Uncharacterized protein n=1 Tax=Naganishia vaughanmartiniae TaxID=1424756 RepID=A0ACC2XIH3_9TREE|nr:hypothetical protein QFC22_001387 [Naganishia vaughanmartiniae]
MVATRSKTRTSTGGEDVQPKIDDALEHVQTGQKRQASKAPKANAGKAGGKGAKKRKTGDAADSSPDAKDGEPSHSDEVADKSHATAGPVDDSAREEVPEKNDGDAQMNVDEKEVVADHEKRDDKVEENASEKVEKVAEHENQNHKSTAAVEKDETKDESGAAKETESHVENNENKEVADKTNATGAADAQEVQHAEKKLAKNDNVIEYGRIHFLYKPKVEVEHPASVDDVQRLHIILQPHKEEDPSGKPVLSRMLHVGRKVLPSAGKGRRQPFWAFVSAVAEDVSELHDALKESKNETKTKGIRTTGSDRLVASGPYCIVSQTANETGSNPERRTSFLCYTTTLPQEPGEVQKAFNIASEGSFTLSVKNPKYGDPPQAGLKNKAEFPEELQSQMGDLRWHAADPASYLDYPNAEILLIASHTDGITHDVGEEIAHELETIADEGNVMDAVEEDMHKIEEKVERSIYDMLKARGGEKVIEGEQSLIDGTWL